MNALVMGLMLMLAGAPPLTEGQRRQLATGVDYTPVLDEPALYPLLENATTWEAGDEAGARVPDYEALYREPQGHRGELFLIEGTFAKSRAVTLARPGRWEGKLQQWLVEVPRIRQIKDVKEASGVVAVYLVDPPAERVQPRIGQRVRLVGRFYKVWQDEAARVEGTRNYLTFVGKTAPPAVLRTSGSGFMSGRELQVLLTILILILAAAYFIARRGWFFRVKHEKVYVRQPRHQESEEEAEAGPPLPSDPVAAMEELERRRKAKESGEESQMNADERG